MLWMEGKTDDQLPPRQLQNQLWVSSSSICILYHPMFSYCWVWAGGRGLDRFPVRFPPFWLCTDSIQGAGGENKFLRYWPWLQETMGLQPLYSPPYVVCSLSTSLSWLDNENRLVSAPFSFTFWIRHVSMHCECCRKSWGLHLPMQTVLIGMESFTLCLFPVPQVPWGLNRHEGNFNGCSHTTRSKISNMLPKVW